jgi:hypothetical protein
MCLAYVQAHLKENDVTSDYRPRNTGPRALKMMFQELGVYYCL